MQMIAEAPATRTLADKALRRQIDRSVSRALVDREFESLLLTDPTVALGEHGCPPQQFKSLRSIKAHDIVDFARQAQALFWLVDPTSSRLEAALPFAAAR
jgi:hypothetical protein